MEKKIFTFLLFLFLSSCGYEAIYSLKNRVNYAFQISKLELSGDRQVNLKIKQILSSYSNPNIAIESMVNTVKCFFRDYCINKV